MFTLPELGYEYSALEPHIDAATMQVHHSKHHSTYVAKLNEALEKYPDLSNKTIEELLTSANNLPDEIKTAVINNGGGHYNHMLFWETMKPGGADAPSGKFLDAITAEFGSLDELKTKVNDAGLARFGSGWSWLVDNNGKLEVYSTPNQDGPLMEGKTPILGVDVWEHAYYLKYQNKRPDYLDNWWHVVNWSVVEQRFNSI